ncbi:hypothetical protein BJX63DRAFT_106701 [Aspergillus granulosus]|uniref:Uncharacterized protein n=1 Tax=Aspergillus granulosus TaxID=176169 RepID=A0ABR4GUB1_9EURO
MIGLASTGTKFSRDVQDANVWAFRISGHSSERPYGPSLTLIVIGEGIISVTGIVNKTVRPGGWTKWSFVHILTITTNMARLPCSAIVWCLSSLLARRLVLYLARIFRPYPRRAMSTNCVAAWAQLHFLTHVVLILLLVGSQILALGFDITLKLLYPAETILFACKEPRPPPVLAIRLFRQTIEDMEIENSQGAISELLAIYEILGDLTEHQLCPIKETTGFRLTQN